MQEAASDPRIPQLIQGALRPPRYALAAEGGLSHVLRRSNGGEQEMLPRFICAGAIVLLVAGPAVAQSNGDASSSKLGIPIVPQSAPLTPEQIERQKSLDRDYEATMRKLPNKKTSADPWGDIRPAKNKQ